MTSRGTRPEPSVVGEPEVETDIGIVTPHDVEQVVQAVISAGTLAIWGSKILALAKRLWRKLRRKS